MIPNHAAHVPQAYPTIILSEGACWCRRDAAFFAQPTLTNTHHQDTTNESHSISLHTQRIVYMQRITPAGDFIELLKKSYSSCSRAAASAMVTLVSCIAYTTRYLSPSILDGQPRGHCQLKGVDSIHRMQLIIWKIRWTYL